MGADQTANRALEVTCRSRSREDSGCHRILVDDPAVMVHLHG